MTLLFVPVTDTELTDWAAGGRLPGLRAGYRASAELGEAFGATDAEEAEHIALLVASVAALAAHGQRLIAVVEGAERPAPGGDPDFGEVLVADLAYDQVQSLFTDAPGTAIDAAAAAAANRPLTEAWEQPAVVALLGSADLLWHAPGEWARLGKG